MQMMGRMRLTRSRVMKGRRRWSSRRRGGGSKEEPRRRGFQVKLSLVEISAVSNSHSNPSQDPPQHQSRPRTSFHPGILSTPAQGPKERCTRPLWISSLSPASDLKTLLPPQSTTLPPKPQLHPRPPLASEESWLLLNQPTSLPPSTPTDSNQPSSFDPLPTPLPLPTLIPTPKPLPRPTPPSTQPKQPLFDRINSTSRTTRSRL